MALFKHKASIQIRFKDTDAMGHVNNANFFTYVESARTMYFVDVLGPRIEWKKQDGVILARTEINYRQPILFEDKICVYTRCSRIGTKSLDLSWVIARENVPMDNKENIFADGVSVLVAFDYSLQKSIEIPTQRVQVIENFEGQLLH